MSGRSLAGGFWVCLAAVALACAHRQPAERAEVEGLRPSDAAPGPSRSPSEADRLVSSGLQLYIAGKRDQAGVKFRKAVALEPGNAGAHVMIGQVLSGQRRFDDAAAEERRAIGISPNLGAAHDTLGYILVQQGRWKEALPEFRKAVALEPANGEFRRNLAATLRGVSEEESLAEYRKAIQDAPKDILARIGLGRALYRKKLWNEAEPQYREAILLGSKLGHFDLGLLLKETGRKEEALKELELFIQLAGERTEYRRVAEDSRRIIAELKQVGGKEAK